MHLELPGQSRGTTEGCFRRALITSDRHEPSHSHGMNTMAVLPFPHAIPGFPSPSLLDCVTRFAFSTLDN